MIDLIVKIWYKKQKSIDDITLYKFILAIVFVILYISISLMVIVIIKMENNIEAFILLNAISIFLVQYNIPIIKEELKSDKNRIYLTLSNPYKLIFFTVIKRNILLLIFVAISISQSLIFLFIDPIYTTIIIITTLLQLDIIVFRLSGNKYKIISMVLGIMKIISIIYIPYNILLILCIFYTVFSLWVYNRGLKGILLYNSEIKSFRSLKGIYHKNSIFIYISTFMKRLKRNEYLDIGFNILVGTILYRTAGVKYAEWLLLVFLIAKFQIILEAKQIRYMDMYLKNAFLNSIGVSQEKKVLYSTELKLFFLEFITVGSISIMRMFFEGINFSIILWGINILLLMYLNISKVMKVFYHHLDNKYYFKGIVLNLVLFYIILLVNNVDFILNLLEINIHVIYIEIIKFLINITFLFTKFESIFKLNIFRGEYEEQQQDIN